MFSSVLQSTVPNIITASALLSSLMFDAYKQLDASAILTIKTFTQGEYDKG